jgi:hypothetical protein
MTILAMVNLALLLVNFFFATRRSRKFKDPRCERAGHQLVDRTAENHDGTIPSRE